MATKPIPEGYHTVTPYLAVDDAAKAIEFWGRAFGATEQVRMDGPDGKIAHAELEIGDSRIMVSDQFPQSTTKPPKEAGATTVSIMLYVEDVDSVVQDAVDAGATISMPIEDMFWGDRFGAVTDPFGHQWSIATHVEDVSPEDIEVRAREAFAALSQ
jgi:PhnB protein